MTRTSEESYAFAIRSGLINRRRRQVFEFCCVEGQEEPYDDRISRNDVKRRFNDDQDAYCVRLKELARIGLMVYAGEKQDSKSQRMVDCYKLNREITLVEIQLGILKVKESQARMTFAKALTRLVTEVDEWVLPKMPDGIAKRNLLKAIKRAQSREPGKAKRREDNGC